MTAGEGSSLRRLMLLEFDRRRCCCESFLCRAKMHSLPLCIVQVTCEVRIDSIQNFSLSLSLMSRRWLAGDEPSDIRLIRIRLASSPTASQAVIGTCTCLVLLVGREEHVIETACTEQAASYHAHPTQARKVIKKEQIK